MAATSSHRPEGFGNASPFQTKRVKKNPVNMVAVGLFALAIVIAGAVTFVACGIEGPNF